MKNEIGTKFELAFEKPANIGKVNMLRIDDMIHYASIRVPGEVKEFKYRYLRMGLGLID